MDQKMKEKFVAETDRLQDFKASFGWVYKLFAQKKLTSTKQKGDAGNLDPVDIERLQLLL